MNGYMIYGGENLDMQSMDVIKHMNEFRNILSYSQKIGFFFGAGTSCAFGLPNILSLTDAAKKKLSPALISSFEKIVNSANISAKNPNMNVETILNIARQIRDITNEDERFSYIGINGVEAKELDIAICCAIFSVIRDNEESANVVELQRFFAWYDSSCRDYVKEIFTLNYDMLMEMAMESQYIPYLDGFSGSYEPFFNPESIEAFPSRNDSTAHWIRLWKLHGSLNWMVKEVNSLSTSRIVRSGKIDLPENELMIYPSREKYNLSRKQPFIAYFDRLKNYLVQSELLFICSGYSFCDEHINEIIYNALRQNNRLYLAVFCFTDDQVGRLLDVAPTHMNLCVMGPKTMIVNGIIYKWNMADSSEDHGCNYYWNNIDSTFTLGNFTMLVDFLIENSGRKSAMKVIIDGK